MPLFGSKFTPKKGPQRRSPSLSNLNLDASEKETEFGVTKLGPVKMKLGSNEVAFENGQWIVDSSGNPRPSGEDAISLHKQNKKLHEENNLLRLKMAFLIDTLTKTAAENLLLQKDLEKFQRAVKK